MDRKGRPRPAFLRSAAPFPPVSSENNREPFRWSARREFPFPDSANLCPRRAGSGPFYQLFDQALRSFGFYFHGSVGEVSHPARKMQFFCRTFDEHSEPYPLHKSGNDKMYFSGHRCRTVLSFQAGVFPSAVLRRLQVPAVRFRSCRFFTAPPGIHERPRCRCSPYADGRGNCPRAFCRGSPRSGSTAASLCRAALLQGPRACPGWW